MALENDLRHREMAAMRAAAEADKESLLKRLGRKKLTDTVVGEIQDFSTSSSGWPWWPATTRPF